MNLLFVCKGKPHVLGFLGSEVLSFHFYIPKENNACLHCFVSIRFIMPLTIHFLAIKCIGFVNDVRVTTL